MAFLRKLMLVGNRLSGRGSSANRGLGGLAALEEIDLQMNPCTLSFYLPTMLPGKEASDKKDANWTALDAQFRRQLPDEWYSKRLVYRGRTMAACPAVRVPDSIAVEDGERRKAAMLLEYWGCSERIMTMGS